MPLGGVSCITLAMVVSAGFGEAVDAGADQEVRAQVLRQAEELVDVALAIADVDAALRRADQLGRAAQVVEPADALLLVDRHAGRVDLPLQRRRALELVPRPDLHRGEAERQPVGRDREARVQQQAAQRVLAEAAVLLLAPGGGLGEADLLGRRAGEGEFRRVLEHQDRPVGGLHAQGGSLEVAGQYPVLAHLLVREEAIGGLGVRPVLKRRRQRLARSLSHCCQHRAQPPVQPGVAQATSRRLLLHPTSHCPAPARFL